MKKAPLELPTMSLTILAIPTVVQTIYLKRDITLRIPKVETRIVQLSMLILSADQQDHIIGGFCG